MKPYFLFLLFFISANLVSQPYYDYIGNGHTSNVSITASSNVNSAARTIDGSGMDGKFFDASRFMAQATLGADSAMIVTAMNMGYEAWINDQFNKNPSYILPMMNSIWTESFNARVAVGQDPEDIYGPYGLHFNYAWWQVNMTNHKAGQNNDVLRQRVAMALSEILVVSMNSDLREWGEALSSYYDILIQNSFGNYKDLLKAVSKSVPMGYYLSHLNNPKTDLVANIRPDENYAREIMQLFSIGLFMLNQDGTEQLDNNGFPIPTYDNDDIKEMAKIFTGLYGGTVLPCPGPPVSSFPPQCPCWSSDPQCSNVDYTCCWWPTGPEFGLGPYVLNKAMPMVMSNENHEPGPKYLPDGTSINIPNNGMAEVDAAIDWLINHQNTGPFISYRLIQRLVKSNPSPAYVSRVAAVFNNNGNGVKGDLKAVVKAILLDDEARNTNYLNDNNTGMLRNPTLRYTHFCKSNVLDSDLGRYWNNGYNWKDDVIHHPLASPSVFNFYTPFYAPNGPIKDEGLVAPEFKIMNSNSSINYLNYVNGWASPWQPWGNTEDETGWVMWSWEGYFDEANNINYELDSLISLNSANFESIAENKELMLHQMDKMFTHGTLKESTKTTLRNLHSTFINYPWENLATKRRFIVKSFLYFIFISPEYNILK